MKSSVIALLFLLMASFGGASLWKKKIEHVLPMAVCAMVLWLYGFYLAGWIRMGLVLLCIGIVAVFLLGIKKAGSVNGLLRVGFTPGMLFYLVVCLIFLLCFSGYHVSLYDELRLWGAVPKAIHATGALQLGKDSPIFAIMQSYPPGLPLLLYFFAAFSGEFSEGALYVGYTCAAMAFFVPAFSGWDWKHKKLLLPVGMLVLLCPFLFTSHNQDAALFGLSLFVDALLGVVMGYCFCLTECNVWDDPFESIRFALTLMVLCLLKDTGVIFALASLLAAVPGAPKQRTKRLVLFALAIAAGWGSWRAMTSGYDVHNHISWTFHLLDREEICNVLRGLFLRNMVAHKVPLGFFLSFVFLGALLLAVFLATRRKRQQWNRHTGWSVVCFAAATAAYVVGYAMIYGKTMESFERYMMTPLLGLALYDLLLIVPECTEHRFARWFLTRGRRWMALAVCGCVLVAAGVAAVWKYAAMPYSLLEDADREAAEISQAVRQELTPGESARVYLVIAGDGMENAYEHHRIFFDMISEDVNLCNKFAQTQVVVPGLEDPAGEWAKELRDGCNFVYVLSVEDALYDVFEELSEDEPEAHGLYRVVPDSSDYGVCLHKVQEAS